MKTIVAVALCCVLSSCASINSNVCTEPGPKPTWSKDIMATHSSRDEKSSIEFAKISLSQQILTDVSYSATLEKSDKNTDFNSIAAITSNLRLTNLKQETYVVNSCYITWVGVNNDDAHEIVDRKWLTDAEEAMQWFRIKDKNDITLYRSHVKNFPAGRYSPDALKRIKILNQEEYWKLLTSSVVLGSLIFISSM